MKKLLVVILAVVMFCTASVAVSAESTSSITGIGGSDSASVAAQYTPGSATVPVYRVDITWGDMEFTYTDASEGTWNPDKHEYSDRIDAVWSCEKGADEITVVNHSNAAVKATFSYAADEGYDAVTGTFDKAEINLLSAVGTTVEEAPTGKTKLILSGALPDSAAQGAMIGNVTVTLVSGN